MLRDRLVCGLRNQKLQQRLLAESNLTFTKAFGLAQTAELSEQNAKDLQRPETMESAALARPTLFTIDVLLRTYSGERLNIRGEIKVDVQFRDKQARLNLLVVVMRNGPSLMGRDWISVLQPNFSVLRSSIDGCLQSLLGKHSVLFKEELGQIKGVRSIWILRPGHFFSNQDQYHMPCELEWRKKLNRLEAADITEPVTHSDLAAPVVPMVKGDGSIRLCGDYKLTVNRVASLEKNPLPRIEDMISSLGKRKEARPCQCLFSGAVLALLFEDGSEWLIAFASCSLAPSKKKYSQIEKEGLAIIYGVKRFHQYLLGRYFIVYSDHKPLQYLFSESRPIPAMASARIQRWALILSACNYRILYRSAREQSNADGLSRLPVEEAPKEFFLPGEMVLTLGALSDEDRPVTVTSIRAWTAKDLILARVKALVLGGWPGDTNLYGWPGDTNLCGWPRDTNLCGELRTYQQRAMKLSVQDGCVLWGSRVVIPPAGHAQNEGLARGVVWWPGMDSELESKVNECEACQANRKSPPKVPLHPWEWPSKPWSRLYIDHAGPFLGKIFLIVVDAYSKWLEVVPVVSTSSQQTIRELRHLFATHGLPEIVVSDNGTAFSSTEFGCFMKHNGIRPIRPPVEIEETEGKQSGGEGDCTDVVLPATSRQENPAPETPTEQEIVDEGAEETPVVQEENVAQRPELRRSSRPHHPPDRYGDHVWKLKGKLLVIS
eukprot:Em0012g395a